MIVQMVDGGASATTELRLRNSISGSTLDSRWEACIQMPDNDGVPEEAQRATQTRKKSPKKARRDSKRSAPRVVVSAEQLPRKSLEQSLRIARTLRETFAGGPASWQEIAKAMDMPPNPMNKYYLWSAQAYGLVQKDEDKFSLTEIGRKIIAPTASNEDKEATIQAVLTPVVFSRFFTDYNGNPFPKPEHIGNVLEVRYGVPRERVQEANALLRENGLFAGILQQQQDGVMLVQLNAVPAGGAAPAPSMPQEACTPAEGTAPAQPASDFGQMCFVITPIGEDDSEQRKHANLILKNVIEPVLGELGLKPQRADLISRAGLITQQIFECLAKAKICVADLSYNNPNAFYELGVRHMCKLPTVQIIRKGDKIPFDVSQGRTIKIDMTDVYSVIESVESAKKELKQHIKYALSADYKGEDNPVNTYLPGAEVKIPK